MMQYLLVDRRAHYENHHQHLLAVSPCSLSPVLYTIFLVANRDGRGQIFSSDLATKWTRHLTLIKVRPDPICPLCQEEEETVLHLLGRCNVLALTRFNHLGSHRMDYNDLSNIRWPLLLKLAKASGRFL